MALRHPSLRSESVMSAFGELKLDAEGFISNREELEATDEQLASLPGFISNDDFPLEKFPLEALAPEAAKPAEVPPLSNETLSPTEDVVLNLLLDQEGKHFNTQGNLDLNDLNTALNQRGLGRLNRAECNALVARVKELRPDIENTVVTGEDTPPVESDATLATVESTEDDKGSAEGEAPQE